MKKTLKFQNLKVVFTAILSAFVLLFGLIGMNSFKKVSADFTPGDIGIEFPGLPEVDITWKEVRNGDTLGGKYYAFHEDTSSSIDFGGHYHIANDLWEGISYDCVLFEHIELTTVDGSGDTYYVIYIPEEINEIFSDSVGLLNVSLIIHKDTKINSVTGQVYSFEYVPGEIVEPDEPETPEEPETPDEPETPEDILVLDRYAQIFELPNYDNKSDWEETEIVINNEHKETYAGRWYRWKKPTTTLDNHLFNVQFSTNGTLKTEGITFNLDKEKIYFSRFAIEYTSVVIDDEVYFEFYIPETFSQKSCVTNKLDVVYEDYFDSTYVIQYKNPNADVVFITEPERPSNPSNPGGNGGNGGNNSSIGYDDADGEEDYTFAEKVGAVVCEVLNVEDTSPLAVGWVTLVLGGIILGVATLLIFKK